MNKIKVMHVLCMGEYSGAENVAITLINSMKEEVDSVYVSPSGNIQEVLKENNIRHYAITKVTTANVKRAIREIRPDIIHAHDFHAGVICAMSTLRIPIVNHLHNNALWIKKCCVNSVAYALISWRFNKILTVSESIMDEYIFGKCLKRKTQVIGNPINLQKIKEKAEDAEWNNCSDVLFLGRLSEPKNPVMFVDIIGELVKEFPQLKAAIVGDGELREAVEREIKRLQLKDHITLWGFQKNPYGLLKNTKVMCMPSLWEGFGLAAVEALSLGKPVVAAPVGGLNNIIGKECGSLCNSLEAYVQEIRTLLSDVEKYSEQSTGALKRAEQLDNMNEYKSSILEVYDSVKD